MGLIFKIAYHELVVKDDIARLSSADRNRIENAIKEKLTGQPAVFGKPLRRSLKGYRKLRVGDYRIIFRIEEQLVKIFYIGHRSVVYKKIENRL